MKKLATTILASLTALSAATQAEYVRPRLVVGIVVDQLRTDYIEYLREYFGRNGFNTLFDKGVYLRDVNTGAAISDATTATAMLYTGAYPADNGVCGASVFDVNTSGTILPLATSKGGIVNNDSFTPAGIRLSTLTDELAIDQGGGSIYSVAFDPQQAVVMAGHSGKGAYWVNNTSGNWATGSYYGQLPTLLSQRNSRHGLSQRLDTMKWTPSAGLREVSWLPAKSRLQSFRHTFSRKERDAYRKYAASALSNTEVTDVAIELLNGLNLGGTSDATDMLNVAYTAAPYKYGSSAEIKAGVADTYLRLDAQLGRLFEAIDRRVGKGNTVIWLTSTGYYDEAAEEDERYRLPGGEFSTRKARSLLNSYLSARHGNAQFVATIRDGQVFFDHKAIEALRLDADKIISDARAFLLKMSGVADAISLEDIINGQASDSEKLRRSIDVAKSGDIHLRFIPGWTISYDDQTPPVHKQIRESAVMTPAFIMAPGLPPHTINTPVESVQLAPTLTETLRIRAPNGARHRGIQLR